MLEASVQRRFPKGLKIHVHSVDKYGCLVNLTRLLKEADLSVTRAKVPHGSLCFYGSGSTCTVLTSMAA